MPARHRVQEPDDAPLLARLRALCLALPGVTETRSWGHPNFRTQKCVFVTYEWVARQPSMAFRVGPDGIARYLAQPRFFATPYGRGEWISLKAGGRPNWRLITTLVQKSHRLAAPAPRARARPRRP